MFYAEEQRTIDVRSLLGSHSYPGEFNCLAVANPSAAKETTAESPSDSECSWRQPAAPLPASMGCTARLPAAAAEKPDSCAGSPIPSVSRGRRLQKHCAAC